MMEINKLYLGDCLEVMKTFPDKSIDLTLTDPPYGINIGSNGTVGGGSYRGKTQKFDNIDWDSKILSKEYIDEILRISKNAIIWGGNYYLDYLPSTRCMLVWYKRDGLPIRTFADCEIAWTNFDKNSQVFNCRWDGFIRDSDEEKQEHPTQKALEVMKWCISEFSKENDLIFDPFFGSGTTIVAARFLKRNYIGCEINKDYFELAQRRIYGELFL
jgi:site-specific DNA-methyltransferase (adenine-specific)